MTRLLGTSDLRIGTIVALCLVCGLGDPRPQRAAGQEGTTLDVIEKVWSEREDKTKTLQFEWTGFVTYAKDSLPSMLGKPSDGAAPGVVQQREPTPPQDVTHEYQLKLTMDGELFRYTREGPDWLANEGRFLPRVFTAIFDGTVKAQCFNAASDGSPATNVTFPMGFLSKPDSHGATMLDYHLWGVLLAFRPLYATRRILDSPTPLRATGERGVVDGRSCVLLRKTKGNTADVCWVDVARACSIARYERIVDGKLFFKVDVSYEPSEAHAWVPTAWRWTLLYPSTSGLQQSGKAQVTAHTINAPVDPKEFELRFPTDTWVQDEIADQVYIVRADGSKRVVTREEQQRGATYLDALHSDSAAALSSSDARGRFAKIVIGSLLAIALVSMIGWLWMRRYRRRGGLATHDR